MSHDAQPLLSARRNAFGRLLPGLVLVSLLCLAAFTLARIPGFSYAGPLGLALVLGIGWRFSAGVAVPQVPGVSFAARTLLRLGIVLLGVRLDFTLLYRAGPGVLALDLLIIVSGLLAVTLLGRLFRLPRTMSLLLAVGSAICGASAIVAAAPLFKADEDDVSQSVAVISVVGVLGVIAFTLLSPLLSVSDLQYGLLLGATLQEVGHVMAAGAAGGAAVLDGAAVTKLTRVALLAPVLIALSLLFNGRSRATATGPRVPLLPNFLIGFLALGALGSLGVLSAPFAALLELLSLLLLSAAMVAMGLGVSREALHRTGTQAFLTAGLGFLLLVMVAGAFLQLPFSPG